MINLNEKELNLLDRCFNSIRIAPYEINDFISLSNKIGEAINDKKDEEKK